MQTMMQTKKSTTPCSSPSDGDAPVTAAVLPPSNVAISVDLSVDLRAMAAPSRVEEWFQPLAASRRVSFLGWKKYDLNRGKIWKDLWERCGKTRPRIFIK